MGADSVDYRLARKSVTVALVLISIFAYVSISYLLLFQRAELAGWNETALLLLLLLLIPVLAAGGAREYLRNRKLSRQFTALSEVDRVATRTLDLDEVLSSALNRLLEVTGLPAGDVYLLDEHTGLLLLKGHKGLAPEVIPLIERLKIGEGVAGAVVKTGMPVIINDISDAPENMTAFAKKAGAVSIVGMPIRVKDRIVGVIDLVGFSRRTFTGDEIDTLEFISNQLGVAVENARLFSELSRHAGILECLYDIDRVVIESLDIEDTMRSALSKALEVIGADSGSIHLLDDKKGTLVLRMSSGLSPEFAAVIQELQPGEGVTWQAVDAMSPIARDITDYPSPGLLVHLKKEGIVSIASTPLLAKGKVLGAMTFTYHGHRIFTRDDLDLLYSIGSQIGIAIQNARLFNELEKHHEELKALYTIESVVSRSLKLQEIFDVALSTALEVTDTEAGTLYSLDGNVLRLAAIRGLSGEFREKALTRQIGEGIPGIAAKLKKPIALDISNYPSHPLLPYVMQEKLVSFIGTPLMSKGTVVGAMSLGTKKQRLFSQDDLDLMYSIGEVIGVAVENARLYEDLSHANITLEKSLAELKAAYEELSTLDKMKDEFLSNISHELKTPLVSIKGYSELMRDDKLGSLSDAQAKALETIIRNADRLTRLIDSLLFLSLSQAGKLKFRFEPVNVVDVIEGAVSNIELRARRKGLDIRKDISGNLVISGSRDNLIEVLENLLDNAIKFTPGEGMITVSAREEPPDIHITVSDTGIGIPADALSHLFRRFYQVDASRTRKHGGAGLGLYISKNIVEAHRGRIWIESEEGKGTSVHIMLPVLAGL